MDVNVDRKTDQAEHTSLKGIVWTLIGVMIFTVIFALAVRYFTFSLAV